MKKHIILLLALCTLPIGESLGKLSKTEKKLFQVLRKDFQKLKKARSSDKETLLRYLCQKAPDKFWNQKIGRPLKKQTRRRNLKNHLINQYKKAKDPWYHKIITNCLKIAVTCKAFAQYHSEIQRILDTEGQKLQSLEAKLNIQRIKWRLKDLSFKKIKRYVPGHVGKVMAETLDGIKSDQVWKAVEKLFMKKVIGLANIAIKDPTTMDPRFATVLKRMLSDTRFQTYHAQLKGLQDKIASSRAAKKMRDTRQTFANQYESLYRIPNLKPLFQESNVGYGEQGEINPRADIGWKTYDRYINSLKNLCDNAPKEFWNGKVEKLKNALLQNTKSNFFTIKRVLYDHMSLRLNIALLKILLTCNEFKQYHPEIKNMLEIVTEEKQPSPKDQVEIGLQHIRNTKAHMASLKRGIKIDSLVDILDILERKRSDHAWQQLKKPFIDLVIDAAERFTMSGPGQNPKTNFTKLITVIIQKPQFKEYSETLESWKDKVSRHEGTPKYYRDLWRAYEIRQGLKNSELIRP